MTKKSGFFLAFLRWLAVLPSAFLAYLIMSFAIAWLNGLMFGYWTQPIFIIVDLGEPRYRQLPFWVTVYIQLMNSIAPQYIFVVTGAYVAPAFKLVTAISLTGIHLVLLTVIVTASILIQGFRWDDWLLYLSCPVSIAATVFACFTVRDWNGKGSEVSQAVSH